MEEAHLRKLLRKLMDRINVFSNAYEESPEFINQLTMCLEVFKFYVLNTTKPLQEFSRESIPELTRFMFLYD